MRATALLILCTIGVMACLLQVVAARPAPQSRFFDDCSTSSFNIINGKKYVGGKVYSAKKLKAGGFLACNELCQQDIDCWSWNYQKDRKQCFIMASEDSDMSLQSATGWVSGSRECAPFNGDWENAPTDPSQYAPASP